MKLRLYRWLAIWTIATAVGLTVALGAFVLAGVGWLSWGQAAFAASLLGAFIGLGLGWFNPRRSPEELWSVSALACGLLFAIVVAQYLATIVLTPGECSPDVTTNCFDEHSAAVGGMAAFGGLVVVALVLGATSAAGAYLRRHFLPAAHA